MAEQSFLFGCSRCNIFERKLALECGESRSKRFVLSALCVFPPAFLFALFGGRIQSSTFSFYYGGKKFLRRMHTPLLADRKRAAWYYNAQQPAGFLLSIRENVQLDTRDYPSSIVSLHKPRNSTGGRPEWER